MVTSLLLCIAFTCWIFLTLCISDCLSHPLRLTFSSAEPLTHDLTSEITSRLTDVTSRDADQLLLDLCTEGTSVLVECLSDKPSFKRLRLLLRNSILSEEKKSVETPQIPVRTGLKEEAPLKKRFYSDW